MDGCPTAEESLRKDGQCGGVPNGTAFSCESTAPLLIARGRAYSQRGADLKSPPLSSNTDAEREAELTQLNGKLYTVEKAQFNKGCPAVANGPAGSVVR
jgi:hypothetical protein